MLALDLLKIACRGRFTITRFATFWLAPANDHPNPFLHLRVKVNAKAASAFDLGLFFNCLLILIALWEHRVKVDHIHCFSS